MSNQLLLYAIIMASGTFICSISQVLLKKAANKQYDNKIQEYLNFRVVFAYGIFFLATFIGIFAYKVVPLSMGPIIEATSYIYVTFFGVTIFKEKINKKKLIALVIIITGIIVYSVCGI